MMTRIDELLAAGDRVGAREALAAVTANDLLEREAAYNVALGGLETARVARLQGIRAAMADGWSYARIGETLGLSRQRVGQLAAEAATVHALQGGLREASR